jgi:hypothetical protein
MRHDWEMLPSSLADVCKHGWDPRRRCKNCGVTQQRYTETAWMRVTGYRWLPLVGRCKPKPRRK